MNRTSMCGYCCELCKAYTQNIKRVDERKQLLDAWKKYYNLDYQVNDIYRDGCRCDKTDAKRIDKDYPVRKCVTDKGLTHCGECGEYPCETFMLRKGMSLEEAKKQQGDHFSEDEYIDYLSAYDNQTRLDEYLRTKLQSDNNS